MWENFGGGNIGEWANHADIVNSAMCILFYNCMAGKTLANGVLFANFFPRQNFPCTVYVMAGIVT